MKRFGIIGDPVAHSMSPRLFTAAYHGRYPYDLIEGSDFEASWQRFLREYDGINVTAPFKEKAFNAVDRLSPEAERIGAVNLVVKAPDGTTTGYNSDYDGVVLAIREAIPRPGGKALVIGCGGAGKAAAAAALDLGYDLTLTNRDTGRAERLARSLSVTAGDIKVIPPVGLTEALPSADLVLYTVPGPLDGFPPEAIASLLDAAARPCFLLEANYRDPIFAKPGRYSYISGLRWLLHQAAAGYVRFTGETPDTDAIARQL